MPGVDCQNWSSCGVAGGGCCSLNLYGSRPSVGVCGVCASRVPIPGGPPATPTTRTVAREKAADLSCCVHRGAEIALRACGSCSGTVQIRVFGCEVHGECSLTKPVGAKVCATCADRKPLPTP